MTSKAQDQTTSNLQDTAHVIQPMFSRNCPAESLSLCHSGGHDKQKMIDADLRSCRSERQLFTAADNVTSSGRCLSFKDLANVSDVQWTRVRDPVAYMTYPMDVDLKKVVMAYSNGLALNVNPINNPSLSVVRSSKSVCQEGSTDSYLTMIIVKSALTNYAQRLRFREVLRRQTVQINATVGILFSLGLPANGQVPPDLLKEIAQFDDVLLANYTDTYLNLTLKTIVNLRFVHRFCLHASSSFVFLDDDHAINLTQLHKVFSNFSSSEVRGGIFGYINSNTPVLRAPGRKWFTERKMFPFAKYPDYAAGPCYILGADLIPKFSIGAAFMQMLPIEDVFVGLITLKLGLRIHPLPNMYIHQSYLPPNVFPLVAGVHFFDRQINT
ncbi:hypothetical protein SprV_0501849700 [Sparganum proliferum]